MDGEVVEGALSRDGTLARRVRRAGPLLLALVLSTWLLYDHVALVRAQEALARDAQTRVRAALRGPRGDGRVVVVRITDADYASLFHETSPLDPAALQHLLDAILQGRPSVVGVDIDTSDPAFRTLDVRATRPERIVWARGALALCGCRAGRGCGVSAPISPADQRRFRYCSAGEHGELVPLNYLGGRNAGSAGLAALRNDDDGAIRRFSRALAMSRDTYPTFADAVARRAGSASSRANLDRPRFIYYRPLSHTAEVTASEVIHWARENPGYDALQGRIVLVGGSYWAARDEYPTPLGRMPGVDIHAQIVESELRGASRAEAGGTWVLVALLVSSLGVLWIFHVHPVRKALRRTLLLWVPATATIASLVSTGSLFALWPFLVPIQLLIVLQQVAGEANEYRNAWFERAFPLTADGRVDPAGQGPRLASGLRAQAGRILTSARRAVRGRAGPGPTEPGAPPAP